MKALSTAARLTLAALAAFALAASASSRSSAPPAVGAWNAAPPAAQQMDPRASHGLWKTTFGAVKIEEDAPNHVHGVWVYDRSGQQVIGYFGGALEGDVLRFTWREPGQAIAGQAQLGGEGWLRFDPTGARFAGRWWTTSRDRQGDWSGWRGAATTGVAPAAPDAYGADAYGGAVYGNPAF